MATAPPARWLVAAVALAAACGGPLEPSKKAIAACVNYAGCGHTHDPSGCIEEATAILTSERYFQNEAHNGGVWLTPEYIDCMASAHGDCAKVRDCFGAGAFESCATPDETCNGSKLMSCFPEGPQNELFIFDCASAGLECLERSSAPPFLGACGLPCAFDGVRCNGSVEEFCDRGVLIEQHDCMDLDATCDDKLGCVGRGASCKPQSPHCEGAYLVTCENGRYARTDCGALDPRNTCKSSSGYGECAPERSCDITFKSLCDSGTLTLCALGETLTIHCSDYGFSACEGDHWGASCIP